MADSKLMDIEPGGEDTPYESAREFTVTPAKQTGQMGWNLPHTTSEMRTTLRPEYTEQGDKEDEEALARKLGAGDAASGMSDHGERGTFPTQSDEAKARRQQGYGPGSGVGG